MNDPLPANGELIEVHVGELKQLFNAMDAAPFRERDLDPRAEEFIVDWSREVAVDRPLVLVVHLSRQTARPADAVILRQAVHEFFCDRALRERRRLKRLFRLGRTSLVIGLVFLGGAIVLGDFVTGLVGGSDYDDIVRESFLIGGWVALWRPLEIFLYDWWPIRAEAHLYDRLSTMLVRVVDATPAIAEAGGA